jgi:hypothetical protein
MFMLRPSHTVKIRLTPFCSLVCQKIIQQRYGFSNLTLSSNRSINSQQQQSPLSNQLRILSNSQSIPSTSYLTQTAPASVFSSHHYDQQSPILSSPIQQNFAVAKLVQSVNTPTMNGVLKDRNNQQQQQNQIDKRRRSFKEQQPEMRLSTLSETNSLPVHENQTINEQITPTSTPTQKRKETKRKSNIFTVRKIEFFFLYEFVYFSLVEKMKKGLKQID